MRTNDPAELSAACLAWNIETVRTAPGPRNSAMFLAQTAHLQLGCSLLSESLHASASAPADCISLLLSDRPSSLIVHGTPLRTLEIGITDASHLHELRVLGRQRLLSVTLPRTCLLPLLGSLPDSGVDTHARNNRLRIRDEAGRRWLWQRLLDHLCSALRHPQRLTDATESRRWETAILEDLAAVLVGPVITLPQTSRCRHALDAAAYLRLQPHRNVGIAELARYIATSARNLHLGFQQCFSLGPSAYGRLLRLHRAHAELQGPASGATVTDIAFKWGFSHLGRFAVDYRAYFGRPPSSSRAAIRRCIA